MASMRGCWELDPDEVKSLNITHAVAFHRGVTRAVVEAMAAPTASSAPPPAMPAEWCHVECEPVEN